MTNPNEIPRQVRERIRKEAELKFPPNPTGHDSMTTRRFNQRKGYVVGAEHEWLLSQQQWVSVKERLPDVGRPVLVYTKHWTGVGCYKPDDDYPDDCQWQDESTEFIPVPIIAWRELPPPPQNK